MLLYQNMVIEEGNGPQAALDHLEKNASSFLDHYYVLERRGTCTLYLTSFFFVDETSIFFRGS